MRARIIENLEIERWVNGGDGLGIVKVGPLAGLVVFVPGTVPGDFVDVEITRKKKRWARGRVKQLSGSSNRTDAPCKVQDVCGGCPWMQGVPTLQREQLHTILQAEVTKRIGREHPDAEIEIPPVISGGDLNYRNRLRLAYKVDANGGVLLGFRAGGSEMLVGIERCEVAREEINEALPALKKTLAKRPNEQGEVRLLGYGGNVAGQIEPVGGRAKGWMEAEVSVEIGDAVLPLPASAFVQGNTEIATRMAEHVEDWARRTQGCVAVELFCGAGTFTVPLLKAGMSVTGYDAADDCIHAFDAATRGWGKAVYRQQDLLGKKPVPENPPVGIDVVLLDPPRSGAGEVIDWVAGSSAKHVLMISCDIATGLRDVSALMKANFRCRRVQSYDLFPHTGHQELIIELERCSH